MISKNRINLYNYSPLIILVGIIMVIVTAVCLIAFLPKSYAVQYDIIYDGIETKGMIIRDEYYYDLQNYEKLHYNNIVEGQFVEKDTDIVLAYKKGYIKNTLSKLIETETSIVNYLNNIIVGYDDKNIHQFDFEIDVTIKKMSQEDSGFIEQYSKLCNLMKERAEYIRLNFTPDKMLEDLYKDEENLIASIDAWRDHIKANNEGFVGFYCDGAENQFNSSNALNLGYSDYFNAVKKGFETDLNGFKIVSDSKWYLLVETDEPDEFVVGNYYQVYISNEAQYEYGCVEKIIDDKKGDLLVFSFNDNVEKYLDLRETKVFIGSRYEGYSVKTKFVKDSSVIIKQNKKKTKVPVEVLYSDKDKTVFKYSEQISLGQKVYNK